MDFTETNVGQSTDFPAKLVIYGIPKIGKSRFAAQADDVFFLNIEDGLQYLPNKVRATPKLNTYDEVISWLKHIYEDDSFKAGTIALDSLDWLESLAQQRLVKLHNAQSIRDSNVKDFAFFKGVIAAAEDAWKAIKWLDAIYNKKGIKSILIAHSQIREVDLPTQDAFQRYELNLSKYLGAKANEWADLVLFCDYSFHVTKDGKTSEPKPVLCAGGNAAYIGGGRMQLDKELPIDYNTLKQHIERTKK